MGKNFRYSTITGSLNKVCDRFMAIGYREGMAYEDLVKNLVEQKVLDGVELSFSTEGGVESDSELLLPLLKKYNIEASFVNSSLFGERKWAKGSLSSPDKAIRRQAVEDTKKGLDYARTIKADGYNLWTGQDGFDYALQTDYRKQWKYYVESVQELAEYAPDVAITLEPKLREPRNRSFIDTVPTGLLVCSDVGFDNVGLTVDVGHTLQAGGNMARDLDIAMENNRLFNVHVNDNYGSWDDDMIVGSVRLVEYIEMFYILKKGGYDKWISVDIFPYREDPFEAVRESILYMKKYEEIVDRIGIDKLDSLIAADSITETMKVIRESVFK